ncbi:MAG: dienelactone hydrolase, partial [Maricaulis maris]
MALGALAIGTVVSVGSQILVGPAQAAQPDAFDMSNFVRIVPTEARAPAGTVYILPGSSGFDIFGDPGHYHRAAREWGRRCYDVVMVDYRAAYIAAGRPRVGETGHKIAWATAQARTHVERLGFFQGDANLLAAWSLGGEGVWALSADGDGVYDWDAAILYYPSNQDDLNIAPAFPSLAMVGMLDDVTPPREVSTAAASNSFLD